MSTPRADRLAASRVSDRRTRPPLPSATWVSDARSALMPLGRFTARAGVVLVAMLLATGPIGLSRPAGAQPGGSGVVSLTSQDAWVQTSSVPVRLGLRVHSSISPSDLLISVALYTEPDGSSLASRDEFDATLAGQLAGLSQLRPYKFSLGSIRNASQSLKIYVAGSGLPGRVPAKVPGNRIFQLPCPQRYGGCGGVYPLQVSLVDTLTGQPLDSFTTYLVVVPSSVAPQERLRFSFVLPVGASVALTAAGRPAVSSRTLALLDTIEHSETRWPKALLTVDLYGQTLLALARSTKYSNLVNTLASRDPDTLVDGPFSAVDPTQLIRAGLENDLASQLKLGNEVFTDALHVRGSSRLYVATTPVGTHGLSALAADGVTQIVVPQDNLESLTSDGPAAVQWPYTLSAPFHIAGSTVKGLQADAGLAAHLSGSASSALRAQQLLADLAELYFDSPEYPQLRGVALVASESWAPAPGFLNATLRGLQSSPIVATVPIGQLFQTVPRGTCQEPPSVASGCSAAVRSIVSPPPSAGGPITSAQVQAARIQVAELSSIIPNDNTMTNNLNDAILLAETAGLDPGTRQAYLSASLATMRKLDSKLSLPAGRTVTVTSSPARFPIAIASGSRTPLHAILVISGANLTSSINAQVVLKRGTTSFIVRLRTRTSGDSRLLLQLLSPTGRLELARAELTIRSTAISGVAIALTVGAAAFLLFWWFRSASRRRRRYASRHGRSQPDEPTSGTVPEPAS